MQSPALSPLNITHMCVKEGGLGASVKLSIWGRSSDPVSCVIVYESTLVQILFILSVIQGQMHFSIDSPHSRSSRPIRGRCSGQLITLDQWAASVGGKNKPLVTDSSLFILLHFAGMIYSSSFIPTLPIQPLNWNILASTFFPDHCVIPLSSNLTQSWLSILSQDTKQSRSWWWECPGRWGDLSSS